MSGYLDLARVVEEEEGAVRAVGGASGAAEGHDAVGAGLGEEDQAAKDDEEDAEVKPDRHEEARAHLQGLDYDLRKNIRVCLALELVQAWGKQAPRVPSLCSLI